MNGFQDQQRCPTIVRIRNVTARIGINRESEKEKPINTLSDLTGFLIHWR